MLGILAFIITCAIVLVYVALKLKDTNEKKQTMSSGRFIFYLATLVAVALSLIIGIITMITPNENIKILSGFVMVVLGVLIYIGYKKNYMTFPTDDKLSVEIMSYVLISLGLIFAMDTSYTSIKTTV